MPKHWNCFVAGCTSNFSSKICGLKYHRIPRKLVKWYDAFFKTDNVNWENAVICSLHWSKGRKNFKHLPDLRTPEQSSKSKGQKRKSPYERSAKRSKARRFLDKQLSDAKIRLRETSEEKHDQENVIFELQREISDLKECNDLLKARNANLQEENDALLSEVTSLKRDKEKLEDTLNDLKEQIKNKSFDWINVEDKRFEYLCGLQKNNFLTIFKCFEPFLYLLKYEGCKTNECHRRSLSKVNELFACLIICRHGLHLGIISWFLGLSESSMSRIFEAWMTFGHAVFSKLNLTHPKNLVQKMMPRAYKNLDFSHIVLVIDATEFKTSGFTNLELNELFFSDYKNSHTVKALPCLTPHGSACLIPPLYPGSITDTMLTDMVGALDNMICHDGVLTDKGKYSINL